MDTGIVYAREPIPDEAAIFLAGPTPRRADVASWRPAAHQALRSAGWDGIILNPESRPGTTEFVALTEQQAEQQHLWEWAGLDHAAAILMWVPRDVATLPGFTTNAEWGLYLHSGRLVFGAPAGAPHTRYLFRGCRLVGAPTATTLADTAAAAIRLARA